VRTCRPPRPGRSRRSGTPSAWDRCSADPVDAAFGAPEGEPPFLGIGILSFDDQEAFAAAAASPEFDAAIADVPNFADARMETAFVEEVPIVG
jgi:uncharacterized protein (TIGR02118 family)